MHEAWFADEDRVRKAVGLLERPVVRFPNAKEVSYHKLKIEKTGFLMFRTYDSGNFLVKRLLDP